MSDIAVVGPNGMLGKAVVEAVEQAGHRVLPSDYRLGGLNDIDWFEESVVINCAGVLPYRDDPLDMVQANAYGPWELAEACRVRRCAMIQVSTDCVFRGDYEASRPGRRYTTRDVTAPADLYGRTKLVGEVSAEHVTVVRTSFIGPDHGLLAYYIRQAQAGEPVNAWRNAFWTGGTVWAVAKALVIIATARHREHLIHLATERKISKLDLMKSIDMALGYNAEIVPVDTPRVDRALKPTYGLPSLDVQLGELKDRLCVPA